MPQVPGIPEKVRQAELPNQRLDAAPAVRATASAGLNDESMNAIGGVVKSAQGVIKEDEERTQKIKDKKLTTWSQGLDDQALRLKQNLLYDPVEGVYKKGKGENAYVITQEARVKYDKGLEELLATAEDDDQRSLGKRIVSKRSVDMDGDLLRHEKSEDDSLQKGRHESAINTYRSEAILNYRNPKRLQETLHLQDSAIQTYLGDNGIKGEDANRIITKERSKTLSGIVKRFVVNDQDEQAKAFYDANKDGFTGDDIDDVEQSIAAGTKKGEIYRNFDKIMGGFEGWPNRRQAAAELLRNRPEIRQEVDEKLVREQKIQEMQQDDQRDQIYADATEELAKANYDINAISSEYKKNLSPRQQILLGEKAKKGLAGIIREHKEAKRERQAMEDREDRKAEKDDNRQYTLAERKRREQERAEKRAKELREEKQESDWKPRKDLEWMYETMPSKQLAQVPESFLLQEIEPLISEQSWNKIKSEYGRAREEMGKPAKSLKAPGKKGSKDFQDPKLDNEVISRLKAIPSTGIKDGDTANEIQNNAGKSNVARIFMDNLKGEYKKVFDESGKYPSYDTRQKILDRLTTEATFKKKSFFGLLERDEKKIVGLADKDSTPVKPEQKPVSSEVQRAPYMSIGKKGNLFTDPKTKKPISKEQIEARVSKAQEAKKRGASAREIIEILKKD